MSSLTLFLSLKEQLFSLSKKTSSATANLRRSGQNNGMEEAVKIKNNNKGLKLSLTAHCCFIFYSPLKPTITVMFMHYWGDKLHNFHFAI